MYTSRLYSFYRQLRTIHGDIYMFIGRYNDIHRYIKLDRYVDILLPDSKGVLRDEVGERLHDGVRLGLLVVREHA